MIPYAQIDTVFLDVGNTLISIDFDWVAAELAARGHSCTASALRRAEAAARPGYAGQIFGAGLPAGTDLFATYLRTMLAAVDSASGLSALTDQALDALVRELRPALRPDGRASVLWRSVMPHVPEALATLRDLGLTMVVVSNSDGTVEQSLQAAGLRPFFAAVIDSAIAGYEKPDPRIFTRALQVAGASPARTLHVGDLYQADVTGARSAGLHAVMLDPYDDWSAVTEVTDCVRVPDLGAVASLLASARP